MKAIIKNAPIEELYFRKYRKRNDWRHYALIKTANEKWIWANDYLNKKWSFSKGVRYDFYIHSFLKGKNKGKSFLYDYCLARSPRELKKQFRRQWLNE